MKICIYFSDLKENLVFSNEGLKVGDLVYPIANGKLIDGEWHLTELRLKNGGRSTDMTYRTGFPDDPHTIIDLAHSDDRSHQVRTDHGYGPIESYFKLVKRSSDVL